MPPIMEKRAPIDSGAEGAERMPIALPDLAPILVFDAKLIGRLGVADEIGRVDVEKAEKIHNRRDRRFADADGADVRRFDDGDGAAHAG